MKRIVMLAAMVLCLSVPAIVESGTNFLLTGSGNVRLKRDGWSSYISVTFGTRLRSDDLLRVDGQATVLCADLTAKSVSGLMSTPCSDAGILKYRGARFIARRAVPSEGIPYILYPRNTLVLDSRPLLSWHDTGARSYTVAIMQGGTALWQRAVAGTKLPYPDDEPALEPNIDYLLLVTDDVSGETSAKDPAKGIGFQLATAEESASIRARCDQIKGLTMLEPPAQEFALGAYHASVEVSDSGFSPLGEAWLIFEKLAKTHDTPAVHLWRGDILTRIQLPNEASSAYQAVIKSAELLGDTESEATARAALWRLTGDEAHLNGAIKLYEQLGDEDEAKALRKEKVL